MDELSTEEWRSAAFAANLRRAYGAPPYGPLPSNFAALLDRLREIPAPEPRGPGPSRLDA